MAFDVGGYTGQLVEVDVDPELRLALVIELELAGTTSGGLNFSDVVRCTTTRSWWTHRSSLNVTHDGGLTVTGWTLTASGSPTYRRGSSSSRGRGSCARAATTS